MAEVEQVAVKGDKWKTIKPGDEYLFLVEEDPVLDAIVGQIWYHRPEVGYIFKVKRLERAASGSWAIVTEVIHAPFYKSGSGRQT